MLKYLIIPALLIFFVFEAIANPADSSFTIFSATDTYRFALNQNLKRVEIQNTRVNNYIANNYQVTIPVVEMYNDHIAINKVNANAEGKTLRNLKPNYSYYEVDNIFYSDAKVCYFELGINKKGGAASTSFEKIIDDPRYFTSIYFSEVVKVTQKQIILVIPRWMKAEVKELNFNSHQIKRTVVYDAKQDADVTTYTAVNLPAMEREEKSPGHSYLYPHLLILAKSASVNNSTITYFNTLADQYSWYKSLVNDVKRDDEQVTAKAKELIAGLNTDMDKIKAIFYYVQDNIRYVAFEDGVAGFKPEKADEVLRRKYGDCKGMANLTRALLVSVGFDARLCWLGTNHIAYNYQTPSIAVDNHMICGLNLKGKTLYLDATETYLGLNEYAERIQGRQVLMEDGDKYILSNIPLVAPAQNADIETSKLTLQGTIISGSVNHVWKGEAKEDVLSGINSVKKDNADKAMKRFLSNDNSDYVIQNLEVSSTTNPDNDFKASFAFTQKNSVSAFGGDYYVDLDHKKELMDAAIDMAKRKHDYWFSNKLNISKETELSIPTGFKVANTPANLDVVNAGYEFHIKYVLKPGKLIYQKNILIKNTQITRAQFTQWNADIEQLVKAYNETILLKPLSQ